MKRIVKGREPQSLLEHRLKSFADYDNYSEKDELRESLLTEQGHICCYCMQRISADRMKIEHWQSQDEYEELQLDYNNLRLSLFVRWYPCLGVGKIKDIIWRIYLAKRHSFWTGHVSDNDGTGDVYHLCLYALFFYDGCVVDSSRATQHARGRMDVCEDE